MNVYELANDLDINTAASQTAVETIGLDNPFHPGATVVGAINCSADPGTSVVIEGRDDSTGSWTALLTATAKGLKMAEIALKQEIRVTVNGTAGAGEAADVYLLGV